MDLVSESLAVLLEHGLLLLNSGADIPFPGPAAFKPSFNFPPRAR